MVSYIFYLSIVNFNGFQQFLQDIMQQFRTTSNSELR